MKLFFILIITIISFNAYAQKSELEGTYHSYSDYFIVTDSIITFKYGKVYGCGPYRIKKDKIYIHTMTYSHDNSSKYKILENINAKDKFIISIFNPETLYPCTTFITIKNSKNRKEYSNIMVEKSNPILVENFNSKTPDKKIVLIANGSDILKIPLSDILGRSIKIIMTDNKTLMDETISFNIVSRLGENIIVGPYHKLSKSEKKLYGKKITWPWKKRFECNHDLKPNEYRK